MMYSFPTLRKTFAAASVTFNMTDPHPDACAVKMLSILSMAQQCPLQSAFYAKIDRYYATRATKTRINVTKRK